MLFEYHDHQQDVLSEPETGSPFKKPEFGQLPQALPRVRKRRRLTTPFRKRKLPTGPDHLPSAGAEAEAPKSSANSGAKLDWRWALCIATILWALAFVTTISGQKLLSGINPLVASILTGLLHLPYIGILIYLGFGFVERIGYMFNARRAVPPGQLPAQTPTICIQLPMFNEAAVARRIIEAAAAIRWPKDRLTIQVLDDSTDLEIQALVKGICQEVSQTHGIVCDWIHRTDRSGYKAGALEAGRRVSDAEYIAIFDADFVPLPNYLEQAIPHFYTADGSPKPEIALVQAQWGHLNDEQSTLTAAQAMWVDDHHTLQQSWRSATIGFVNFTGTAGTWRASAIEAIGGWRSASLVEDCELSMRALFHGYQTRFVKEIVAPAELPQTLGDYRLQQKRWTQGWVQLQRLHLANLLFSYTRPPIVKAYLAYFSTISWQWPLWAIWVTLFPFLISHGMWVGELSFWTGMAVYLAPPMAFALFSGGLAAHEARATYAIRDGGLARGKFRRFFRVLPFLFYNAGMLPHHFCAFVEGLFGPLHSEFERTPKTAAVTLTSTTDTTHDPAPQIVQPRKSPIRIPYLATEIFFVATQLAWISYFMFTQNFVSALWGCWLVVCIGAIGFAPLIIARLKKGTA